MPTSQVTAVVNAALAWQAIRSAVNVLPISATPFASGGTPGSGGTPIGLSPLSPYYMLLMRNIVPNGQLGAFKSYLAGGLRRALS